VRYGSTLTSAILTTNSPSIRMRTASARIRLRESDREHIIGCNYMQDALFVKVFGARILCHSFRKFAASRPITPNPAYGAGGLATTSHEKPSVSCHCERSEAISWPIWGLLRRLRRLAMTRMGRVEEFKFPEGKIHYRRSKSPKLRPSCPFTGRNSSCRIQQKAVKSKHPTSGERLCFTR
jgi:hypothetical protein